jgi:membrane-bound ClpP family serine protease
MAVVNCPSCNKKISDKAKTCNHCQVDLSGVDADKLARLSRVSLINKTQRLMNYSFIAMLMFCGGFLFMFWDNVTPGSWQHTLAMICTVLGFFMYIIIRAMLLLTKRKTR